MEDVRRRIIIELVKKDDKDKLVNVQSNFTFVGIQKFYYEYET